MSVLTLPSVSAHPLSVRAKALVFEDPSSQAVLQRIHRLAPSDATILLTGETGTGKEIVARNIHALSTRAARPFVAVNCGALTQSLVESELFGHERGAFTGAVTSKVGWFEAAHGGTLFLDEIGDLPLQVQVKLLRVLQEGEVVRVGARQPIHVDVRLIAATNVNLAEAVAAGHFRGDLFFRLNVATIALPPLRDRPGDILPLAHYFNALHSARLNTKPAELSTAAADRLLAHSWPGNIRELENVVHHALLVCKDGVISAADLPLVVLPTAPARVEAPGTKDQQTALERALLGLFELEPERLHEQIEETVFRTAYHYCHKNQLQTARLLGVSRNVVRARLLQFGELLGAPRRPAEPARAETSERESRLSSVGRSFPPRRAAIRIGCQKFGWLPLVRARGEFERACAERGTLVEWIDFPGGLQLVEAFSSLGLSFGVVGEVPPIFAQAHRVPMVYLAAEASAPDAEAIVVRGASPFRSIAELRGRTIALNRGSNVHYLLIRALEEAGLRYEDVEPVFLPPDLARQAFAEGRVDAWAIWDPWLASLQHTLDVRVLRDGAGLVDNAAYYIASRELSEIHPELVELFLAELDAASAWVRDDVVRAASVLSPLLDMPQRALVTALARKLTPCPVDATRLMAQQRVADAFHEQRLIPRPVSVVEARFVPDRWRPGDALHA